MTQAGPRNDPVETFVVRIYRRTSDSEEGPAGTVECVGCGERRGFVGRVELWECLFLAGTHAHERDAQERSVRTRR